MLRLAKLLAVAVILFCIASPAMAQKAAFIDSEKIQQTYKEWQLAVEQFNTEMRAWEEEAASMEQELRDMFQEYEKQKLILSADKKAEREAAITAKDQALAAFTKEISAPGGRAEQRQQALFQPLIEAINAAIEKVAIEENYDFVFNGSGLAYAKKELDITDKVIEALEQGD